MLPSSTVSANCPALPLATRPKYCSFNLTTLTMSSLSTSSSSRIDLFVLCSRHETPSIFRQHHIPKASILFLSNFLTVHPSAPCRNTAHTICFMTLTFSTLLMLLSFQILVSSVAFCNYMAMIYHCRLKAYYCIDFLGRKIYLSGISPAKGLQPIRTKFGIHDDDDK